MRPCFHGKVMEQPSQLRTNGQSSSSKSTESTERRQSKKKRLDDSEQQPLPQLPQSHTQMLAVNQTEKGIGEGERNAVLDLENELDLIEPSSGPTPLDARSSSADERMDSERSVKGLLSRIGSGTALRINLS